MKKIISLALCVLLVFGSISTCFGADNEVRYGYKTGNYIRYDTTNTVKTIRAKLTVANYMGTVTADLDTTEGSGKAEVLVVYLADNMWDNGSYYSAVSGTISGGTNKIYSYSDELVLWKDVYSYGFLPMSGGIYTTDYNSLQMHFLNGPGLYTALGTICYSTKDLGFSSVEEMKKKAPGALQMTAAGYPFILALDDTTIEYFLENGKLDNYASYDWPGLEELILKARTVLPSRAAEEALKNFTVKKSYYRGILLDVGLGKPMWYDENIKTVYSLGLMEGHDGKFDPNGNITIAQALAMACRLHNIYNGGTGKFSEGPVWYSVYVNYAVKNGIIKSADFDAQTKGNSVYTRNATRAEMAYIFANAMPHDALPKINQIKKVPDMSKYAKYGSSVYLLYEAGIVEGNSGHNYFPDKYITRAEAAAIISRMALKDLRLEFNIN